MRHGLVGRVLLLCVSVLLVLGAVEGILRVRVRNVPLNYEFLLDDPNIVMDERLLFRKKQDTEPPGTSAIPIAVIGDSYSMRDMWEGVSCYPELLEKRLRAGGAEAKISNFAYAGYNFDQEFRIFTDQVLPAQPLLVLWQVYANDLLGSVDFPLYEEQSDGALVSTTVTENWAYRRWRLYRVMPFRSVLKQVLLVRMALRLFEPVLPDESVQVSQMEQEQRKFVSQIRQIASLAEQYDITVMFIHIPPQAYYLPRDRFDPQEQWLWQYQHDIYDCIDRKLQEATGSGNVVYLPVRFTAQERNRDVLGITTRSGDIADTYYLMQEIDPGRLGDRHISDIGQLAVASQVEDAIHFLMPDL